MSDPSSGWKWKVSWATSPPLSSSSRCLTISASIPRSRNRKLFMFLSSVFVPSSSEPAGRMEMFPSTRREPSSMFTSDTPSWRIVVRSSCAHSRASAAERMSGSVTISTSGVPPRLKSTREAPEPWIRPDSPTWLSLAASSSRCARWMRTSPSLPLTAIGSSYWLIW